MNRRLFFRAVAAIGAAVSGMLPHASIAKKADTFASTPDAEFGEGNYRFVSTIYAWKGEPVTCENGHPICYAGENIPVGKIFERGDLVAWQQAEPKVGDPNPVCAVCGARAMKWPYLHFSDGWRISR